MPSSTSPTFEERAHRTLTRKVLRAASIALDTAIDIMVSGEDPELSWRIARDLLISTESLKTQDQLTAALPPATTSPSATAPSTLIQLFSSAAGLAETIAPSEPSPLDPVVRRVGASSAVSDYPDDDDTHAQEEAVIDAVTSTPPKGTRR